MTFERAFDLINNLDKPTKSEPQHSLVFVDGSGKIIDVIRNKRYRDLVRQLRDHLRRHPGAVCFPARPGDYDTFDKRREKVAECVTTASERRG